MRLIDADNTSKVFLKLMNLPEDYCGPSDINISIDAVFSVLGQVPDADPVKHGHWIKRNSVGTATCSICGGLIMDFYNKNANTYCHNCGAKMDGK